MFWLGLVAIVVIQSSTMSATFLDPGSLVVKRLKRQNQVQNGNLCLRNDDCMSGCCLVEGGLIGFCIPQADRGQVCGLRRPTGYSSQSGCGSCVSGCCCGKRCCSRIECHVARWWPYSPTLLQFPPPQTQLSSYLPQQTAISQTVPRPKSNFIPNSMPFQGSFPSTPQQFSLPFSRTSQPNPSVPNRPAFPTNGFQTGSPLLSPQSLLGGVPCASCLSQCCCSFGCCRTDLCLAGNGMPQASSHIVLAPQEPEFTIPVANTNKAGQVAATPFIYYPQQIPRIPNGMERRGEEVFLPYPPPAAPLSVSPTGPIQRTFPSENSLPLSLSIPTSIYTENDSVQTSQVIFPTLNSLPPQGTSASGSIEPSSEELQSTYAELEEFSDLILFPGVHMNLALATTAELWVVK